MTYYIRRGTALLLTDAANLIIEHSLAPANYVIKANPADGFYLDQVDDFVLPNKTYGNTMRHADRILRTFYDREASTGVLLTGEKGSGKSLLAKVLAVRARQEMNLPTIMVNTPFCGEGFNAFIQKIDQPAVILFDEFEKVYDSKDQTAMLTLLDGMFPTKKLFVLTCNDRYRIDSHMRNRPGRLFYTLNFAGMEEAEVRGYCADKLANQSHTDGVVKFAKLFNAFNFDMLKALVEEMNRYNEPANEAYMMLNAQPGSEDSKQSYTLAGYTPDGRPIKVDHPSEYRGLPVEETMSFHFDRAWFMAQPAMLQLAADKAADNKNYSAAELLRDLADGDDEVAVSTAPSKIYTRVQVFEPKHFVPAESMNGAQVFRNADGFTVIFTPKPSYMRNYHGAF